MIAISISFIILDIPIIRITSPNKFREKGPPKLQVNIKNQKNENDGNLDSKPPDSMYEREWERSYIRLALANNPDEHTP